VAPPAQGLIKRLRFQKYQPFELSLPAPRAALRQAQRERLLWIECNSELQAFLACSPCVAGAGSYQK